MQSFYLSPVLIINPLVWDCKNQVVPLDQESSLGFLSQQLGYICSKFHLFGGNSDELLQLLEQERFY